MHDRSGTSVDYCQNASYKLRNFLLLFQSLTAVITQIPPILTNFTVGCPRSPPHTTGLTVQQLGLTYQLLFGPMPPCTPFHVLDDTMLS
jgi:hypothetical protein